MASISTVVVVMMDLSVLVPVLSLCLDGSPALYRPGALAATRDGGRAFPSCPSQPGCEHASRSCRRRGAWPGCCLSRSCRWASSIAHAEDPLRPVPLKSRITHVQPMTGIVFWSTSEHNRTDAIQLEYSYMKYNDVVKQKGTYDWRAMDRLLEGVAAPRPSGHREVLLRLSRTRDDRTRLHQGPARLSARPAARARAEPTGFCDWSHPELQAVHPRVLREAGGRYDRDPRLAFLETGFGLWAEYHIYDGPMELGKTFPDKAFQAEFARHLARVFVKTPWMISVDAADVAGSVRRECGAPEAPVRRVRRLVPLPAAQGGQRAELERDGPRPLEVCSAGVELRPES